MSRNIDNRAEEIEEEISDIEISAYDLIEEIEYLREDRADWKHEKKEAKDIIKRYNKLEESTDELDEVISRLRQIIK